MKKLCLAPASLVLSLVLLGSTPALADGEQVLGPTQLVDPATGVVLLELGSGKRAVKASVAPGHYLLQHQLGEKTLARELDLEPGQPLVLEDDALTLTARPELTRAGPGVETKAGKFTSFTPAIVTGVIALALVGGGAAFEGWSSRSSNASTQLQTTADVFFAGGGLAAIVAGILTVIPIVNR